MHGVHAEAAMLSAMFCQDGTGAGRRDGERERETTLGCAAGASYSGLATKL